MTEVKAKETELVYRVVVPEGIEVNLDNSTLTIKGTKGELKRDFTDYRLKFENKNNEILVIGAPVNKPTRTILMTTLAHIKNMITGAKLGYKYELQLSYSHFPMTIEKNDKELLVKNFLGEKHPRNAKIVGNTQVDIKGQDVILKGYNLEEVGQTAANIEQTTKVRGKDIRRFTDGIYLVKKGTEEDDEEFKVEIIRGRE